MQGFAHQNCPPIAQLLLVNSQDLDVGDVGEVSVIDQEGVGTPGQSRREVDSINGL